MSKSTKIRWYWHRLQAMSPREVLLRVQKKAFQAKDRVYNPINLLLDGHASFPELPTKSAAPPELIAGLKRDAAQILAGQWRAFGHLPMAVSDPPRWQADNVAGKDLQSTKVAFKLDHRAQPGGADIKVIWEPNRWYQLVRLAMAAWLIDDAKAGGKCVEWLHDWAAKNPPFTGLNWTSGLETGLRLIQYTWIDALLAAAGVENKTLAELRGRILGPHVWYTWRYKSFGSSANNHLIGELAGLIVAQARWPELANVSASISEIGALMDREILAQFAEDGGNQEQALGYHLFSWEFCFQSQRALAAAGAPLSTAAVERLEKAARFYRDIKPEGDPWDFGDSDNAWVTPLFADETKAAREWWRWFDGNSPALEFWWGKRKNSPEPARSGWKVFSASGYAVLAGEDWFLRLDFSPLGYLSMAPHGHLDALHLSLWFRGEPVVIDPGTGAYYADKNIRSCLADWSSHNGPCLKAAAAQFPKRFGTFLWSEHHQAPAARLETPQSISAELMLPQGRVLRRVTFLPETNSVRVVDSFSTKGPAVTTRWKFAPGLELVQESPHAFRAGPLLLRTNDAWKMAGSYNPSRESRGKIAPAHSALGNAPLESIVSPAFRALACASSLALEGTAPGPFEVTFSPA